jgi:hypothetical protein
MTTVALTHLGPLEFEPDVPLQHLELGDTVLGLQNPDDPTEPRCVHVVTATFGEHYVPTEDPTGVERFLRFVNLERVFAGSKCRGVLVAASAEDPDDGPALFDIKATPMLDRVKL